LPGGSDQHFLEQADLGSQFSAKLSAAAGDLASRHFWLMKEAV
jgi:hypothetical protein